MSRVRWLDSPFAWAVAGFAIGLGLGVTQVSAWLVDRGLGLFVLYLRLHGLPMPRKSEEEEAVSPAPGPQQQVPEGWLFAGGPAFIVGWIVGFVVRGLIF